MAAPLSMRACWAAVGCFFIMIDFFFLVLVCSLVDVFYCSTNTAPLSTRVDKSAVVRVTLDVGARRAVACNQKQYRFSDHLLRVG